MASYGQSDGIYATDTLLGYVAGGVGHSAHSVTRGLEQVAHRAVDLTEQAVVAAAGTLSTLQVTAALTVGTTALAACSTASTTIGHYALLFFAKKRNVREGSTSRSENV